MRMLDQRIAELVQERGAAAIWQLASLAALAPYIISPVLAVSIPAAVGAPTWTLAVSLAFTLVTMACLRSALEAMHKGAFERKSGGKLPEARIATSRDANGLADRERLWKVIDAHDGVASQAALAVVRFGNYPAMSAFSASGANRVLAAFSQRVTQAIGSRRLAALIDSHTFAVWFCGADAETSAEAELRSIAYVLAQEIEDRELTVAPDIHVGLAWTGSEPEPALALIARAQAAAVPLKRFSQGIQPKQDGTGALAQRFAMEQALRRAVREGQLSLHYQPFVDVAKGTVVGAEALLRWRHPTLGDVSPSHFVPLLEETGLVHDIGLWTLNSACRQLSEWRARGEGQLRIAINLSAVQLQNLSLGSMIVRTVASHGLTPADIELELTETAAMEDGERSVILFRELRELGFGISIDDFGNGHSNLSYLKSLPFTKLKIDREFVSYVDQRPGSQAICKALVELAQGLGISVLAEGVERFEEVEMLRRLGCNVFQGFYFARGMAADGLTRKLADPDWLALIGSNVHRARAELNKRIVS